MSVLPEFEPQLNGPMPHRLRDACSPGYVADSIPHRWRGGRSAWGIEGRVIALSDGDTITLLDVATRQHKVRFAGIDAPEKGQPYGERSKQSLSALVFQKRVEARCHKKDRYGREVCAVLVSLRDVGLEQIRLRMACRRGSGDGPAARSEGYRFFLRDFFAFGKEVG